MTSPEQFSSGEEWNEAELEESRERSDGKAEDIARDMNVVRPQKEDQVTPRDVMIIEAQVDGLRRLPSVNIVRSSGVMEAGWKVTFVDIEHGIASVVREQEDGSHSLKKTVKLSDLMAWNS